MVQSYTHLLTKRWIRASLLCMLTLWLIILLHETVPINSAFHYSSRPRSKLLDDQGKFWTLFRADLERYGPTISPLTHPEDTHLDIGFNTTDHRSRPDLLTMTAAQVESLGKSHTSFVEKIRSREYDLPYTPNSRGIATTAGGPYLPVALVSIRMLRETGSELPVEVFLATWSEWDPVICSKIFPSLNAKCVVLQDIFDYDKSTHKDGLQKYQFKIMSILFSSFEEVLFIDSDCFPIRKANQLFEAKPFKSTGLVLWPDFWFPSESPLFFNIASIDPPPIHESASTEAGEILYSKRKHELSLLLATYYNFYGPDFYYPLQSQGAPGEGDKETFLWSAAAIEQPFYKVKTNVHALGYWTKSKEWRGSAMAQFDPIQDFNQDPKDLQNANADNTTYPRPFFIHMNFPKLDPGQIFDKESFDVTGPTQDSDGTMRRIWYENAEDTIRFFGFDLEKMIWSIVKDIACRYEGQFQSWQSKTDVCKKATQYWDAVFAA